MNKMLYYLMLSMCIAQASTGPESSAALSYATLLQNAHTELTSGSLHVALQTLKQALSCRPADPEAASYLANTLLTLGNQFFDRGENELALESFYAIFAISDQFSEVHHNIGFTLAERYGDHARALKYYEQALALNAKNIETHFCAALSYLACGNLATGFKEYEYRWHRGINNSRNFLEPLSNLWDGKAPLYGKTIVLRAEQGLGDTLQFIRYALLLKQQGAFVVAEVQNQLVPLLKHCGYLDQVIAIGSSLPLFDYQIPLMSLAHLMKTTLATVPATIPYLYPKEELCREWHQQLQAETRFKIGICWHGDMAHGSAKFMPLREFIPLLKRPDVKVYSLQLYNGLEQLKELPEGVQLEQFPESFDKKRGSFMDTAAVMKNLNLVITVDTSIAHLAGGLGVPVWVVLPFPAEWRWLMHRCDSPWYPTMTVFRQAVQNQWQPVMQSMLKVLDELIRLKQGIY
jgi:tetratricopeptide (TPR) repeat protein